MNTTGPKLDCIGCHGANGKGNGPSFIELKIYQDVAFGTFAGPYSFDEAVSRFYRVERDKAGVT